MNHSLRMRNIVFLVVVLFSCSFALQKSNNPSSHKLDFRLRLILDAEKTKTPTIESVDRSIVSERNAEGILVFPCFIYADDFEQIRSSGIQLQSVVKTFATARLTIAELERLSLLSSVKYIAPTSIDYPHNDVARALIGADLLHSGYVNSTQYTGSGVIIGVIDTGIDWKHLDFRDPIDSSQSRILYIWDQTITPTGGEISPASFLYGVEYTQAHINNELDGSPAGFVRESDSYGHGTHVAGTAAGNGSSLATKKYKGMAPSAELIIVKAGNGSFPTVNIIDAISYLNEKATAENKPLVINMSLGSDAGPHDGTDAKGLAVANFSGPGRIAVMSAGNTGGTPIHFSGTIGANSSSSVTFTVPAYTAASGSSNDIFAFDLWLQDGSNVNAQITTPNSLTATQNANSNGATSTNDGHISIYNQIDANNGDREIFCTMYDLDASKPPVAGTWTLQLTNTTGSALTYHGWLYDYLIGSNAKTVTVTGGNNNYTVSNASDSAIIVGSLASRWRWFASDESGYTVALDHNGSDSISSFSSRGPSRSGATKPDIAAPGQQVVSSRSTDATFSAAEIVGGLRHVCMQGTSMSSPVVAGSVALLLQLNSNLAPVEIKSLIASTATTDSYTGSVPNNTWGYGKLDIVRAVIKAIEPSFSNQRFILAYDEWISQLTVVISSTQKISVKFSPSTNGKVVGTFFHPSTPVSLTGPLYAEVWSDNGSGLPGSKIGSTISFDQNAILANSWNHIDMTGVGASVVSGNNYHLVLYYTSGTSFKMFYDNGNNDARSSVKSSGPWATYTSGDYRIRPVLMTDISALPVELYVFTATVHNNDVQLEWMTASEINNFGFEVEKKRMKGELGNMNWEKIGFVEGNGTTNSPKSYSFVDPNARGNIAYRLKQIDRDGKFSYSQEVEVMISQVPQVFALMQNYPNPFNPSTVISYQVPINSLVTLKVYDILGREVATLVNDVIEAGSYSVQFDGTKLSSGIYFYTLKAGNFAATKKLSLLK